MKKFFDQTLENKKILFRADCNVPLINGQIQDDYRLQAILPTLRKLLAQKAIVILATHIGRPKNHEPEYSTQHLIPWFKKQGLSVAFEPDSKKIGIHKPGTLLVLENLRFNPGEKSHDPAFAQELRNLGDFYINDAFGLLHRDDTSITDVPQLFPENKRILGPLIQKELAALKKLKDNPEHPYIAILGGGKVTTKIPILESLVEKADALILAPAIVFTFLKVLGKPYGISLVDTESESSVKKILNKAAKSKTKILYPLDYVVALNSPDGPLAITSAEEFPAQGFGLSIGPKTLDSYKEILAEAKTIFINAAMGFDTRPESKKEMYALLELIASSPAYKVAGGGNTIADIHAAGLEEKFDYLSTGGGATLAYLADEELPGLQAFSL